MYNSKFILSDGKDVYPGYLSKEKRISLKNLYKDKKEYMRCACRPDAGLYYKISEDLKIYPEHKGYVHDRYCFRYTNPDGTNGERTTAYCIDENGGVTVFTSFNPKEFTRSTDSEENDKNLETMPDEDDNIIALELNTEENTESQTESVKKEPKLGLEGLCRSINVDCFTDKALNHIAIEDRQKFSTFVYHRMKKVKLSRAKKAIGELSLENDGVRFIYTPYAGVSQDNGENYCRCYLLSKGPEGKVFKNFVYPEIAEKALKKFKKQYGIEPNEDTMMAGFQYIKKNKTNNSSYRVLGRVHLFQISEVGLYCRTIAEYNAFNDLHRITKNNNDIKFWIPPEDEGISAIIQLKGIEKKILMIYRSKKNEEMTYNPDIYIPLVLGKDTSITEDLLFSVAGQN